MSNWTEWKRATRAEGGMGQLPLSIDGDGAYGESHETLDVLFDHVDNYQHRIDILRGKIKRVRQLRGEYRERTGKL